MKEIIYVGGRKCEFVCTCVEDDNGKWDDSWASVNGHHVLHNGKKHDVYVEVTQ